MNDYITLGGKFYHAEVPWKNREGRQKKVRLGITGKHDVCFGPASERRIPLRLLTTYAAQEVGFGTFADAIALANSGATTTYVDFWTNSMTVVVENPQVDLESKITMVDSTENWIVVDVMLLVVNT